MEVLLILTWLGFVLLRSDGWALDCYLPKGWMAWTGGGWLYIRVLPRGWTSWSCAWTACLVYL